MEWFTCVVIIHDVWQKQFSTEKTQEVICISQWDNYPLYILSGALTRTSWSGNCHIHIFKPEHTGSKQIHTFTWHTCSSQHINGFVLSGSHRFACDTVQGRLIPFQHIWAQELSSMQICSVIQRHDLRNTHSLKIYRILTSLTNHKKTKILFINIYILISIFYIWPIWLAMSCDHCRT